MINHQELLKVYHLEVKGSLISSSYPYAFSIFKDTTALKKVFLALGKRQRKTPSVTRRSERGREGRPQRSELGREGRQLVSRQGDEDCETSYRTEIRPECTTVTETICSNVTVIRTRPDIKENCTTRVTQHRNNSLLPSLCCLDWSEMQTYKSSNSGEEMQS